MYHIADVVLHPYETTYNISTNYVYEGMKWDMLGALCVCFWGEGRRRGENSFATK